MAAWDTTEEPVAPRPGRSKGGARGTNPGGAGRLNGPGPTPSALPTRTELNKPSTPGVCGLGPRQHPAGGSESQPHALHLIRQQSGCPRLEWTPVGAAGGASLSLAVTAAEQFGQRARAGAALGVRPCRAEPGRAASRQPRATYQRPPLVLTVPGGGLLFGPAGHLTLQDRKRAGLNHTAARRGPSYQFATLELTEPGTRVFFGPRSDSGLNIEGGGGRERNRENESVTAASSRRRCAVSPPSGAAAAAGRPFSAPSPQELALAPGQACDHRPWRFPGVSTGSRAGSEFASDRFRVSSTKYRALRLATADTFLERMSEGVGARLPPHLTRARTGKTIEPVTADALRAPGGLPLV